MRFRRGIAIACLSLAAYAATPVLPAFAQFDEPSEQLKISTNVAATWDRPGESVVALQGPVTIELDQATLTAQRAVMWLSNAPIEGNKQRAEIALIGDAKVVQRDTKRSGERLFVTALVSGKIRFTAEQRVEDDRSDTELYETAERMRRANGEPEPQPGVRPVPVTPPPPTQPAKPLEPSQEPGKAAPARVAPIPISTQPSATQPLPLPPRNGPPPGSIPPGEPVLFHADQLETIDTDDGTMAVVLTGNVKLFQRRERPPAGTNELQADKVVLFTNMKGLKGGGKKIDNVAGNDEVNRSITAAYLEGDVRIVYTPNDQREIGEQRMEAKRVYFEFGTDRAILTDAVVHTIQPLLNIPIALRAKIVRQLAQGEYAADDAKLSSSRFANPSYSINASRLYVRREDTGDPRLGWRNVFEANNPTFRFFNTPVFYWPYVTGSMTDRGSIIRGIGFENSSQFGTGVTTKWGLFETLGLVPPKDLDATYRLDYFGDRGPAAGIDAEYGGGVISSALKEQFNFDGKLTGYFVRDSGFDDFGRGRIGEDDARFGPERERGHVLFQHQQFFSDDLQLQFRAGYVSDATFLEQWFDRSFDEGPPHDVMLYLKKQHDTEAFTFLTQMQPSNLVTTSEQLQEQFEVERLPEIGYRRIGDSFGADRFTFFSQNTAGFYNFNTTRATLAEQGLEGARNPGIPALGFTGVEQAFHERADFRQEIGYPIALGSFKLLPYVVGRYTGYNDSPDDDGAVHRVFGAAGARLSTSFWKTYDHLDSELFDVHRVRHIIEPEVNVFTSAATQDRNDVFIYDTDVDAINDLSAVQVALHQRWQTKRGGPGRWRSVDFFTLNLEANFFSNEPSDDEFPPRGFRGLYFPSDPEASVPRDSANADATWRISDQMVVLADVQQNLNENRLATAGIGLLVRRDERLTYFLGNRYIDELGSNITTVVMAYELSPKYTITVAQSYDFGLGENVSSSVGLLRAFDAFFAQMSLAHDSTTDQTSFNFNLSPKGFGYGINAEQLGGVFRNEKQ